MLAPVSLTILCALATLALVAAERTKHRRSRYIAKPLAAGSFVGVAVLGGALSGDAYAKWVVLGLLLGAGGDIGLMLPERKHFVAGIALFWLGHVLYLVAISQLVPPRDWLTPVGLVPAAIGGAVGAYVWPHAGRLRPVVVAYVAVFVTVAMAALSAYSLGTTRSLLLVIGAGLFFASDVAVARHRFVRESFTNKLLGQPAYFAGQLLIAWSAIS